MSVVVYTFLPNQNTQYVVSSLSKEYTVVSLDSLEPNQWTLKINDPTQLVFILYNIQTGTWKEKQFFIYLNVLAAENHPNVFIVDDPNMVAIMSSRAHMATTITPYLINTIFRVPAVCKEIWKSLVTSAQLPLLEPILPTSWLLVKPEASCDPGCYWVQDPAKWLKSNRSPGVDLLSRYFYQTQQISKACMEPECIVSQVAYVIGDNVCWYDKRVSVSLKPLDDDGYIEFSNETKSKMTATNSTQLTKLDSELILLAKKLQISLCSFELIFDGNDVSNIIDIVHFPDMSHIEILPSLLTQLIQHTIGQRNMFLQPLTASSETCKDMWSTLFLHNVRPFHLQVAGHGYESTATKSTIQKGDIFRLPSTMFNRCNGDMLLKYVPFTNQMHNEISFYKTSPSILSDFLCMDSSHSIALQTIPKNVKHQLLFIKDETHGMKTPCIMDIRIGEKTSHHTRPESLCFKISGCRMHDNSIGKTDFGIRRCHTQTYLLLEQFLSFDAHLLSSMTAQLEKLICALSDPSMFAFRFCRTSILLLYDYENITNNKVKLIDFAHVKRDASASSSDTGVLLGLSNILHILQQLAHKKYQIAC